MNEINEYSDVKINKLINVVTSKELQAELSKLSHGELSVKIRLKVSCAIIRVIISRRMRWAGHVARMGEKRIAYRILVGRPEGRRPLWRPRHRWEDNIEMDLQEVGWGHGLDWAGSG
jgi:hypothetical protein